MIAICSYHRHFSSFIGFVWSGSEAKNLVNIHISSKEPRSIYEVIRWFNQHIHWMQGSTAFNDALRLNMSFVCRVCGVKCKFAYAIKGLSRTSVHAHFRNVGWWCWCCCYCFLCILNIINIYTLPCATRTWMQYVRSARACMKRMNERKRRHGTTSAWMEQRHQHYTIHQNANTFKTEYNRCSSRNVWSRCASASADAIGLYNNMVCGLWTFVHTHKS